MNFFVLLTALILNNLNCISCTEIEDTSDETSELENPDQTTEHYDTEWHSYAHSLIDLWQLAKLEEKLFTVVKQYFEKLDHEPEYFFERYIADYEDSSAITLKSWNSSSTKKRDCLIHTNPLLSYRMIWRFVTDLPTIRDILLFSEDPEIVNAFQENMPIYWPTENDLNSTMNSLLNLHFVYDLNVYEFTNGIIANVSTDASLSAIHCFEISKHALSSFKYTLALEWLDVAEHKRSDVNRHPVLDYLEAEEVAELLDNIIQDHDENWIEDTPNESNLYTYLNKIDSGKILTTQKAVLQKNYKGKGLGETVLSLNDISAFSTLCKGGNLQSEKEKAGLYCWYESKINPAWYINPQKMELFSKDPYIFQVYDFVGDELIKYMKNEAVKIMERSLSSRETYPLGNNKQKHVETVTSMFSWLFEPIHKGLPMLSKKIGYLTGLIPSGGTETAVNSVLMASFVAGGHFNLHLDQLESTGKIESSVKKRFGYRLATFMIYLNDVEHGGKTVFTTAGVSVIPVKGSATFFYDSKRNGEVDYNMWHGECPILLGEKWVGNKWLHSNLNIFQHKCTLNKDE